ncbi:MAG: hypothetical protein KIT68_12865 [Phycisphaeraceae bacterium]|nr:hypothetical protein [Phycisphaeraceae bacterium]
MAKRTRITLTRAECDTEAGKALIDMILAMCHDGRLDMGEIKRLYAFVCETRTTINAFGYLRAKLREIIADGVVDPIEEFDLKKAFERIVPKEIRGIISTHLEDIFGFSDAPKERAPRWHADEATSKQIEYIVNLGGRITGRMTKGEAAAMIDELLERRPATPRQVMLLRFFNRPDLSGLSKDEASQWIDMKFSDTRMELAWERFKRETGHDPHGMDAEVVPVGAYLRYVQQPKPRPWWRFW